MSFVKCMQLYNHHHGVMISNTFITSKIFLVPLCSQFHSVTPSSWQPPICFLALWFSCIWYMVSHIVFESVFFHLAYCIWESFVLLCVSVLFYCWRVVVYCIAIPLFINSLVSRHLDCFLMALVRIIAMYKSFVNTDSPFLKGSFTKLTVFSQHFKAVILQSSGLSYFCYEACWSNCCYSGFPHGLLLKCSLCIWYSALSLPCVYLRIYFSFIGLKFIELFEFEDHLLSY